jgi:nucleotide-binding universal stress UspA family protein
MAEILSSKRMEGVSHEVLLKEGFFWQTLDELIREKKIDLVAVGTHGVRKPDHEFMGSSAELVFRHADCPVLTAGPEIAKEPRHSGGFKNILFATDFGRATKRAAFCAFSLARQFGGSLTLLHVADPTECRPASGSATLGETTRIRLAELVPDKWRASFRVECAVQYGDAAEQILRFARDRAVDLIVMGARSGRPLTTHLPQSIVYSVAVSAPCPLITVRV